MDTSQMIEPIYQDYASIFSIHETLSKEFVCLIDEKLQGFIERLANVWTEMLEARDALNRNLYPSDFQILLEEMKQQVRQWINLVPVICFNTGKYDFNVAKKYFVKEITFKKGCDCKEDVFARKKENNMFLFTSKLKTTLYLGWAMVHGVSQWVASCKI